MEIQDKILALREELTQHNYNYYVLDNPTISDFEFDLKLKELKRLEDENPIFFDVNSPTQRVGGVGVGLLVYAMFSPQNKLKKVNKKLEKQIEEFEAKLEK